MVCSAARWELREKNDNVAQVATKGRMDSLCLGCHPCWSRESGAMLVFEGLVSTRAMQIWVACAALLQLGPVQTPRVWATTEARWVPEGHSIARAMQI